MRSTNKACRTFFTTVVLLFLGITALVWNARSAPPAAAGGGKNVWVAYAQLQRFSRDVFVRPFDGENLGEEARMTMPPDTELHPTIGVGEKRVVVAWDAAREGTGFDIVASVYDGRHWSSEVTVVSNPQHEFRPALAVDSNGTFWCASDRFTGTDYKEPPKISAEIVGTQPIERVDVIRNNEFIYPHKPQPTSQQTTLSYVDNAPVRGQAYYYLRVWQEGRAWAWSAPIWVKYEGRVKTVIAR